MGLAIYRMILNSKERLIMKKILIAVDDTLSSKAVLAPLYNLVQSPGKIILLHVERLLGRSLMINMLGDAEVAALREELKDTEYKKELDRKAEKILLYYKNELKRSGYTCEVETVIKDGIPAEEILKVAEQERADLIILGHYSNKGLNRVITGSVAKSVREQANVPVLVANSEFKSEGVYRQGDAYIVTSVIAVVVLGMFILFSEMLFSFGNILSAIGVVFAVVFVLGIIIQRMGALSTTVSIKK